MALWRKQNPDGEPPGQDNMIAYGATGVGKGLNFTFWIGTD